MQGNQECESPSLKCEAEAAFAVALILSIAAGLAFAALTAVVLILIYFPKTALAATLLLCLAWNYRTKVAQFAKSYGKIANTNLGFVILALLLLTVGISLFMFAAYDFH